MERKFWKYKRDNSESWNWTLKFWRVQFQLTVHKHSHTVSNRWVVQPHFVYDCRPDKVAKAIEDARTEEFLRELDRVNPPLGVLIKEADPEFDRLLAEEEEIERNARDSAGEEEWDQQWIKRLGG